MPSSSRKSSNLWSRRGFIQTAASGSVALGATGLLSSCASDSRTLGANDTIRVGVAGINSKGAHHIQMFNELDNVEVVAICDADQAVLDREREKLSVEGRTVDTYIDIRKMLDRQDIDAISIASPNHWHSLMAIWGCQAGKDVYVEKPVSHNVWEGRKVVEAARKYNRIVQTGTQKRSDEAMIELAEILKSGELGKITAARGLCYKRRKSIGRVPGPQPIPNTVNYDLWTGPAALGPLMRENLHYDWHWTYDTGNGDIGNQGVHEMDLCRWMLGERGLPKGVFSFGGRYGYVDDANTANTQVAVFDYDSAPLIFEVRGLPLSSDIEAMPAFKGVRIGIVIHCEGGYFAGGGGGGWLYDKNDKKIRQLTGSGGSGHVANFIKAVRSRKQADLNADIEKGHLSSALCHLGNTSYRLGQKMSPAELSEKIRPDSWADDALDRFTEHLSKNQIALKDEGIQLGPALKFDTGQEQYISKEKYDLGHWANQMLKRIYRPPFVVPERV